MANEFGVSIILRLVNDTRGAMRDISKQFKGVATEMSAVGADLTRSITLPLAAIGAASIKMSTDFNKGMANVGTLIPGQRMKLEAYKKSVQDLAIATGVSTEAMASGLFQALSAWGDAPDIMKRMEINARAAVAGQTDVATAIKFTSIITKSYGDESAAAISKAADLGFMVNKLGQTTFPELAEAMSQVAPLAGALRVSQEELFGALAAGIGPMGNAGEASVKLKGVFKSLLKPSADLQKLIKHLGFSSGQAMVKQLGLQGSLLKIKDAVKGNESAYSKLFPEVEAVQAIISLMGRQQKDFIDKTRQMRGASGSMSEAFNEQANGINKLGFQMGQLIEAMKVLGQSIGDMIGPALMPLIGLLMQAVNWFKALPTGVQQTILVMGAAVAAIGPLLIALASVIAAVGALAATGLAAGAIAAGVLAIGAMSAAIVQLMVNWQAWKSAMADTFFSWNGFKLTIDAIIGMLGEMISMGAQVAKFLNPVATLGNMIGGKIGGMFTGGGGAPAVGNAIQNASASANAAVTVRVSADQGSKAVIDDVKKTGAGKTAVYSDGYMGMTAPAGAQ